jgi:hypothetical protein
MNRSVQFALLTAGVAFGLGLGDIGLGGTARAQEPGTPQTPSGNRAGDPQALSVGVPVRIQDALVTPYGETILETISATTYVDRKGYGVSSPLSETIKYGAAPGLGINLALANDVGNIGIPNHAGFTVSPSFQYVFTGSHGYVPGLSVEGFYTPRPGTGLSGGLWGFSGQLTKLLGPSEQSPRLHVNVEYIKFNDQTRQARPEAINYGLGLSSLLTDRTSIVGDVFYSQTAVRRDSQTFLDVGFIHLLGPRLSVSAGAGAGLDRSTPAGRTFLSLATSF